jgi:hypothetical protein
MINPRACVLVPARDDWLVMAAAPGLISCATACGLAGAYPHTYSDGRDDRQRLHGPGRSAQECPPLIRLAASCHHFSAGPRASHQFPSLSCVLILSASSCQSRPPR